MPRPHLNVKTKGSHGGSRPEKPFFRASVTSSGEFEILIYEEIGEYFDWDTYSMAGTTARSVRQALDSAGTFSKIKVRINSPGGDAFEGVAIGNVLKSAGKPIEVHVDGIAASAASIIAMAGDTISMANNAMMMIHNAWSYCAGDSAEMRKMADTLEKISASIGQTYVDKTGKTTDEIEALMDAETWLSAQDCIDMGFATAIAPANESAVVMARSFKVLAALKCVPESLEVSAKAAADGCACDCVGCQAEDCLDCSNEDCADPNCKDCPMQADASASSQIEVCQASAVATRVRLSLLAA